MRPLIGITTGAVDLAPAYGSEAIPQLRLTRAYIRSILRAGGCPMLFAHETPLIEEYVARCDGFVLSGGPDIDPSQWGQAMHDPAGGDRLFERLVDQSRAAAPAMR